RLTRMGRGKPTDPWHDTRYLYLIGSNTGESFTLTTRSIGGRISVADLKTAMPTCATPSPACRSCGSPPCNGKLHSACGCVLTADRRVEGRPHILAADGAGAQAARDSQEGDHGRAGRREIPF